VDGVPAGSSQPGWGKRGHTVTASPQAPHRLSWLPAFSCLASPNASIGGCLSRETVVKKEEKNK